MTMYQQTIHRIIVGVDFGTTYTGVGWVTTASQQRIQDIDIINDWGGSGATGSYNWKVPTIIAYENENSPWNPIGDKWGFQVKPEMASWAWMKLLLDRGQARRYYDDPLPEVTQHPFRTPEQIITDFLSHVYRFLIGTLERRITPSIVQQCPIEFWFTTPAIWSDQANHATRMAAQAAGFGSRQGDRIFMIQEPEAAAVAVLRDLTVHGTNVNVKPGDGILICDCGGGTVDITTYKVTQTYPTLQFEELVVGSGGKCGSTFVDRRFLTWMSGTFGPAFNGLHDRLKRPGSRLMQEFESHKRAFSSDNCEPFELTLFMRGVQNSPSYDASEYKVKVQWDTMRSFFQPAVDKITGLVKEQVQQAANIGEIVHKVVLVGGFGDSKYLYTELQRVCTQWQIQVLCPPHPQAAIVKGAALRGLENVKPQRKRCRQHYGFESAHPFRPGIDPQQDYWFDEIDCRYLCRHRMEWAMSKGQYMDEGVFFRSSQVLWQTAAQANNPPPVNLYRSEIEEQAERSYCPGVQSVGQIGLRFNSLNFSAFETRLHNGAIHYHLAYEIQVFPSTKDGVLRFRVVSQEQEIGSAQIVYTR